jgi:alkylation response protein AidB-like acyl-CoA dehydrogenase
VYSDDTLGEAWTDGWGPSEEELDECRYEEQRSAAEILVDEEAEALGDSLTAPEREEAIEELLETGVMVVRFEENRGGGSFTPVIEAAMEPRQAIASAQRWRTSLRPRSATVVRRAPIRRAGRRALRKHRRLVRRTARAPGRSEDPHENPVAGRCSPGARTTGGRS